MSGSIIKERQSIQENTRSQIQAVCSEPNLSQERKCRKIRQIRQQAHETVNALISPAELQKLEAYPGGAGVTAWHSGTRSDRGRLPCAGLGR